MPSISDIRQQYPQYNDMSDQQLADSMYSKHYSDMPRDVFNQKIGYQSQVQDAQPTQQQRQQAFKSSVHPYGGWTPGRVVGDVLGGIGQFGQNIHNLLTPKSMNTNVNIPETLGGGSGLGDTLLQGVGQYAPMAAMAPEAAISQVASRLPMVGRALTNSPVANWLTQQLGTGAIYGGTQNPDHPLEGAAKGALLQGALGGSLFGAVHGANQLRPENLFRGTLTPEELQYALDVTKGTTTGLGDVLQSPTLKKTYENILPTLPFGTANETLQNTGRAIRDKGQDILGRVLGNNSPEDTVPAIQEALNKQFKQMTKEKNDLYDEPNRMADENNVQINVSSLDAAAKEHQEALKATKLLQFEPKESSLKRTLSRYIAPEAKEVINESKLIDPQTNKPYPLSEETEGGIPDLSLKEAGLLKGKLGHYSQMHSMSNLPEDRHMAEVFSDLNQALDSDINSAIAASGNKELDNSWARANGNYKENFSPFLQKEIYKYAMGKTDPDTILQAFVKTSKTSDRSTLLNSLMDKLPDEQKGLVPYSLLSRSIDDQGNVNPVQMHKIWSDLGKNQKRSLIGDPDLNKELSNYISLVGKNKGAGGPLYTMYNPKTGAQGMQVIPGALALKGAALGGAIAGPPGALIGGAIGWAGPGFATRPLVKALTSQKIRENLVNKMIENSKNKTDISSYNNYIGKLANSLANTQQPQQIQQPMTLEMNKYAGYQ